MRTKNLFIFYLLTLVVLVGCKKDDNKEPIDPFNSAYSEKSVEENKGSLEDAGQSMVNEMDELKDVDAIDVIINFSSMTESIEEPAAMASKPLDMISQMISSDYSAQNTLAALKSAAEEPRSLSEVWADVVGKYTWNFLSEDWDVTELTNALIFEFPGLETDSTNTAVLTVDNFSAKLLVDPIIEYEEGVDPELPTSLNVNLTYDGVSIAKYNLAASYRDDGMPLGLNTKLTVGTFTYQVDLEHTPYSAMSLTSSFRHGDNILIEAHIDNTGNWTQDNIDALANYEGDSEIPPIEDILAKSNAYIQVFNIKVAGMVNVEALAPALRAIEDNITNDDEYTSLKYNQDLADALNANAALAVVYADNLDKIAKVEAYPYYDESWDEYSLDFRFIFADGSASDAETYFGDGFSDLIDDINSFISDLNDEYDLEIDPVEE